MAEISDVFNQDEQAKWNAGVNAAQKALASSAEPIFMMDELPGISLQLDVEAAGWNSVWASEENRARIKNYTKKTS